jgi:hypothetical protein
MDRVGIKWLLNTLFSIWVGVLIAVTGLSFSVHLGPIGTDPVASIIVARAIPGVVNFWHIGWPHRSAIAEPVVPKLVGIGASGIDDNIFGTRREFPFQGWRHGLGMSVDVSLFTVRSVLNRIQLEVAARINKMVKSTSENAGISERWGLTLTKYFNSSYHEELLRWCFPDICIFQWKRKSVQPTEHFVFGEFVPGWCQCNFNPRTITSYQSLLTAVSGIFSGLSSQFIGAPYFDRENGVNNENNETKTFKAESCFIYPISLYIAGNFFLIFAWISGARSSRRRYFALWFVVMLLSFGVAVYGGLLFLARIS